ncbi:MAG TPA: crossover junction endodeoxyribonuclease RuvC [Candidatus Nanoarchaeia archaeon]|nr:crossover junction endodeoxyribonuclease RuvC [Candidatus Nanoarchaeia archaeon]
MLNNKNDSTIVLAIDPGYDRLGVAILKQEKGKQTLLFSDCITTDKKLIHPRRLAIVGETIAELIQTWQPRAMAVEELFFSKNVKTALNVAQALGVITYEAAQAGLKIYFYKPVEVKIAVTGYGASDKTHVLSMVPRLIKMENRKRHDDEYDAIAVGITHLASYKQYGPAISTKN